MTSANKLSSTNKLAKSEKHTAYYNYMSKVRGTAVRSEGSRDATEMCHGRNTSLPEQRMMERCLLIFSL